MGRASTENTKAINGMLIALDNPQGFDNDAIKTMLKVAVAHSNIHQIEELLESIGLELFDLDEFKDY
jgi:hypothetical protein